MASELSFRFGEHIVKTSVVFFRSKLSFGFVNRKPVLPGHVLVAPVRVVDRFGDLTSDEISDLFLSAQKIARVVQQEFNATALTVAIQDGPDAGQTVAHVHVHILPRRKGDFQENDGVYKVLEQHDKEEFQERANEETQVDGMRFRSEDDMSKEASLLAAFFKSN